FKIRCKKCSALLVLRGDASQGAQAAKGSPALTAEWHVVVDGEQQGPLTVEQLKTLFANGKANWESYVWRDGMSDWLVAQEVAELPKLLGIDRPTMEAKTAPHPNPSEAAVAAAPREEDKTVEVPVGNAAASSAAPGDTFSAFDVQVTIEQPSSAVG